jgi:hypothetical protein
LHRPGHRPAVSHILNPNISAAAQFLGNGEEGSQRA